MTRVVLDTNVLVSAMIRSDGNEALIVLAVNYGLLEPLFSEEILSEYREVLLRPKFGFQESEVSPLLDLLVRRGRLLEVRDRPRLSPDAEDDKFIACALEGEAEFLVTGNKRHFPQNRLGIFKVVTAGELLDLITLSI